jgi:hypothetical protein
MIQAMIGAVSPGTTVFSGGSAVPAIAHNQAVAVAMARGREQSLRPACSARGDPLAMPPNTSGLGCPVSTSRRADGAELEAARVLLTRLGVTPGQVIAATGTRSMSVPTFAEYSPRVSDAVTAGTRRVYETYWRRVVAIWGGRQVDEPTASEIGQLAEAMKQQAVERGNSRGGRTAAEHLIALRCVYRYESPTGYPERMTIRRSGLPNRGGLRALGVQHRASCGARDRRHRFPGRDCRLTLRFTSDEVAEIEAAAASTGMTHDRLLRRGRSEHRPQCTIGRVGPSPGQLRGRAPAGAAGRAWRRAGLPPLGRSGGAAGPQRPQAAGQDGLALLGPRGAQRPVAHRRAVGAHRRRGDGPDRAGSARGHPGGAVGRGPARPGPHSHRGHPGPAGPAHRVRPQRPAEGPGRLPRHRRTLRPVPGRSSRPDLPPAGRRRPSLAAELAPSGVWY